MDSGTSGKERLWTFFVVLLAFICLPVSVQGIGELRLVNSTSNFSTVGGRLEIFLNDQWGTVCNEGFSIFDATLACNQLGFRSSNSHFGQLEYPEASESTPIWISNLQCNPDQHLTLYHCPRSSGASCNHSQDVYLTCLSPYPTRNNIVRLVAKNGYTRSVTAGRLEIHLGGKWGTYCINGFDLADAMVFCDIFTDSTTVLAYGQVRSKSIAFEPGPSSSPVWEENTQCISRGNGSYYCFGDGPGITNCTHSQDVAISCLAEGAVRLVSGSSPIESTNPGSQAGRLEVYHNGEWGSVCQTGFGQTDANVVCQQLGYRNANRYGTVLNLGFSQGVGRIWLKNIGCRSTHATIIDCAHSNFGSVSGCFHFDDVAVECDNFQLRLVGKNERTSSSLTAGRVEVLYNGQWGSICNIGFGSTDASILCSMLTGSYYVLDYGTVGDARLTFDKGPSSSPVWLENLSCSRSSEICTHSGYGNTACAHNKDIALSCGGSGAVRLMNSSSTYGNGSSSGRLEVYYSGQWGTVCSDGFDKTDADVVCQQLGYSGATRYGTVGELGYPQGSGALWLTNVRCSSDDFFLANCSHSGFGNTVDCSHRQDVAVTCATVGVPLSVAAIAGIAAGGVLGGLCFCVTCLGFVYVFLIAMKKRRKSTITTTTTTTNQTATVSSPSSNPRPSAPPPKANPALMGTVKTQREVIILKRKS